MATKGGKASGRPGTAKTATSAIAGRAPDAAEAAEAADRDSSELAPVSPAFAHGRFGVTLLFVALAFGIVLETLHGFKAASYLMDPVRMEFWSLAHFHGVGLALVNLVYISWAERSDFGVRTHSASMSLMVGSVLLPLGFLLGGIGHYGSDPGLGIFLAPVGAVLILFAIGSVALALWRR